MVWSFGDNDEDIKKFVATSDSDNDEGRSSCKFEKSAAGYGLFSGNLDSTVPEDGKIKRAGYCNIKSLRVKVKLHVFDQISGERLRLTVCCAIFAEIVPEKSILRLETL